MLSLKQSVFNKMLLLYLIGKMPDNEIRGSVKLQKLLYFIEKRATEIFQMRGAYFATYIKHSLGPYSRYWDKEVSFLEQGQFVTKHCVATTYDKKCNVFQLTKLGEEAFEVINKLFTLACPKLVEVIDEVLAEYGNKTGGELSEISHNLPEYKRHEILDIIIQGNDPNDDVFFPELLQETDEDFEDELEDLVLALDREFMEELKASLGECYEYAVREDEVM